jgi:hypothetical protein
MRVGVLFSTGFPLPLIIAIILVNRNKVERQAERECFNRDKECFNWTPERNTKGIPSPSLQPTV